MYLRKTAKSGFTLIELMVAMAILAVLVMMLAKMLGSGTTAFNRGTNNVEVDNSARAVMDFIRKDISTAIWDEQAMALAVVPDSSSGVADLAAFGSNSLYLQNSPLMPVVQNDTTRRHVQAVRYRVQADSGTQQYKLVRTTDRRNSVPLVGASGWQWWKEPGYFSGQQEQLVAENVVSFRVLFGYGNPASPTLTNNAHTPISGGTGERLVCLDVILELLDAESAREVDVRWSADSTGAQELAAVRKRIYTSRISFNNKYGNSAWSLSL